MEELNEIKKQFDELMAKAEEIVKKNGGKSEDERWRAEEGRGYWIIDSDFRASSDIENETGVDFRRWKAGNYFETEEEAEKVAQYLKDYLILRADAKGYEPKGSGASRYFVYSDGGEFLCVIDDACDCSGVIYFKTKKDAEASIAKHGDIWKRYLGVEE